MSKNIFKENVNILQTLVGIGVYNHKDFLSGEKNKTKKATLGALSLLISIVAFSGAALSLIALPITGSIKLFQSIGEKIQEGVKKSVNKFKCEAQNSGIRSLGS